MRFGHGFKRGLELRGFSVGVVGVFHGDGGYLFVQKMNVFGSEFERLNRYCVEGMCVSSMMIIVNVIFGGLLLERTSCCVGVMRLS